MLDFFVKIVLDSVKQKPTATLIICKRFIFSLFHAYPEGDLCEDGVFMRNGFFRTRHFAHDSEASIDLFAEDRQLLSGSDKEEEVTLSSQVEAQRRKERLEKEEFLRKCRVRR